MIILKSANRSIIPYAPASEMFGERFLHSGHPAEINTKLTQKVGFTIISDKIDQPGNQVILAKKESQ